MVAAVAPVDYAKLLFRTEPFSKMASARRFQLLSEARFASFSLGDYIFKKGQPIFTIGNPGLGNDQGFLKNALSKGVISTKTSVNGLEYFQLGISVNPGNSGGPVIDEQGKVVGMVTLKARMAEGVALCIPPDLIMFLCAKAKRQNGGDLEAIKEKHNKAIEIYNLIEGLGIR